MTLGWSVIQRIVRRLTALAPSALGDGDAAVDGVREPAGPRFVQAVVSGTAVVIHAAFYAGTGRTGFLWVAIFSALHLLVGIPLSIRVAQVSVNLAAWGSLFSMLVGSILTGDPITLLAWFPLLIITNLLYLDTIGGFRNAVAMTLVACVFYLVMVNTSDQLFDGALARSYLAASLFMWVLAWTAYSLAIGGAVNRRTSEVQAALHERDEAEARARSEATRLRAVLESAPIGLMLQGADQTFEYANGPALEMLGIREDELFATGTAKAMERSTFNRVAHEVALAWEQRQPFSIEFQTLGGRVVELRGRNIDLGRSWTTVTTLRDLTPERNAQRHIARLRTLVENSRTQMVVWNRSGRIVVANRVFRDMWSPDQPVEGRLVTEVVGDQIRPLVEMADLETENSLENEMTAPNGLPFWVDISVADFPDPFDDEWLRSISVRDLTEVAVARRQLEELVMAKDRFIASVSHELRTPLTVVVGLAAELAAGPEHLSAEELQEYASLISSQANEVTAIVEDLLTMARGQADVLTIHPQTVDLEAVVSDVIASLPRHMTDRVSWVPRSPQWVWADPVRLRQIVRNLLTNAHRHGGPAVEVEITSGRLCVKDNGTPVPPEDRERIFGAYEKIRHATGRTDSVGLGLAVCRLLSRMMDGDVRYTHDGYQAIFTLTMPRVRVDTPMTLTA